MPPKMAAPAPAAPPPNPSGSMQFPGMTPTGRRPVQEVRWHAEIDAKWARLSQTKKDAIKAYCARWGPMSKPQVNSMTDGDNEFLRAKFWRGPTEVPRCHSCWGAGSKMPAVGEVPIGLHSEDIVPCGCKYSHAIMEQVLVGKEVIDTTQQNSKISTLGRNTRSMVFKAVSFFTASDELTVAAILDKRIRRDALTRDIRRTGAFEKVEEWPEGS